MANPATTTIPPLPAEADAENERLLLVELISRLPPGSIQPGRPGKPLGLKNPPMLLDGVLMSDLVIEDRR